MRERGLVLEVQGQEAVVLTQAGEFRRLRLRSPLPQVGEEIILPRPSRQPWWQWAAAAVLLVAVSAAALGTWLPAREEAAVKPPGEGTGPAAPSLPVVRWVTIDINPSVELGLDGDDRVVSARALNEDGARLLGGLALQGKPAQEAVEEVASRAVAKGYLVAGAPENTVLIAVTGDEEGRRGEELRERLHNVLRARQVQAEVESIKVDAALRESAARAGLSVGKYAIWLQATAEGLNVDPDRLRRESLARAIREAGGNLGEVVGKAHQQQEFHRLEEKVKEMRQKMGREDPTGPAGETVSREEKGVGPALTGSPPGLQEPDEGGPWRQFRKQPQDDKNGRAPEFRETVPPVSSPEEGSPSQGKERPRREEDLLPPREGETPMLPGRPAGRPEQERNGERSERESGRERKRER